MLDRRTALGGAAGLVAGLAVPAASPFARSGGKPRRLRPGDLVGLVEPASFSDDARAIDAVRHTIKGMGLVPKIGRHVGERHGYFAGTDRQRAADINAMYADDEVRAVFAIRGGWGSARILPHLDWDIIRAHPKLLIGFSDTTALHLAFAAKAGFATIHSPNAAGSWPSTSWNSLWWLAFAKALPVLGAMPGEGSPGSVAITPGKARGKLLGGNLSVLAALVGTPYMPDMDGAILFLEDVGEAEYRIDRMMSQLALSGMLGRVAGVVFGQCARYSSGREDYTGFTIPQVLEHRLAPLDVPVFRGANIGHVRGQWSLPVGCRVEMDAAAGTIRVLESPTR